LAHVFPTWGSHRLNSCLNRGNRDPPPSLMRDTERVSPRSTLRINFGLTLGPGASLRSSYPNENFLCVPSRCGPRSPYPHWTLPPIDVGPRRGEERHFDPRFVYLPLVHVPVEDPWFDRPRGGSRSRRIGKVCRNLHHTCPSQRMDTRHRHVGGLPLVSLPHQARRRYLYRKVGLKRGLRRTGTNGRAEADGTTSSWQTR